MGIHPKVKELQDLSVAADRAFSVSRAQKALDMLIPQVATKISEAQTLIALKKKIKNKGLAKADLIALETANFDITKDPLFISSEEYKEDSAVPDAASPVGIGAYLTEYLDMEYTSVYGYFSTIYECFSTLNISGYKAGGVSSRSSLWELYVEKMLRKPEKLSDYEELTPLADAFVLPTYSKNKIVYLNTYMQRPAWVSKFNKHYAILFKQLGKFLELFHEQLLWMTNAELIINNAEEAEAYLVRYTEAVSDTMKTALGPETNEGLVVLDAMIAHDNWRNGKMWFTDKFFGEIDKRAKIENEATTQWDLENVVVVAEEILDTCRKVLILDNKEEAAIDRVGEYTYVLFGLVSNNRPEHTAALKYAAVDSPVRWDEYVIRVTLMMLYQKVKHINDYYEFLVKEIIPQP